MCSAFTPVFGHNNGPIILTGDAYCPNTKYSGKLCMHRKIFQSSGKAIINARKVRLCVKCAKFFLKIKQIPFFVAWSKGLHF